MKLSRSTEYALLAVETIARHAPYDTMTVKRMAQEHQLPMGYLQKVLQQLVRANILESLRGPQGGFVLAKSVDKITLLEIIEAVEGPLAAGSGPLADQETFFGQSLRRVYQQAAQEAAKVLGETTLAHLMEPASPPTGRP